MADIALSRFKERVWTWIWEGPPEAFRGWRVLPWMALRVLFIVYREFKQDAITMRASALTYMVVLSIIPVLALSTAVLKGLGAGDQMRQAAYKVLQRLEEVERGEVPPQQGAPSDRKTLTDHLRRAADKVFDYVDRTNFAALGVFGILGLLFTVVSLFGRIEQAMNAIWGSYRGRSWGRRAMDYLALIVLLPVAVNVGLAAMAALESPVLLARLQHLLPLPWFWRLGLGLLPLLTIVATFTLLYRFLPNARVSFKAALAGGLLGGTGWVLLQSLYVKLQIGVARYNAIYGSFATIPLFLLWVYMGWVVFLTGAEIAYAFQFWRTYPARRERTSLAFSLALAFDLMRALYEAFRRRHAPTGKELAQGLGQPEGAVIPLLEGLKGAGLIREVEDEEGRWVPSAPPDEVSAQELVEVLLGKEVPPGPGGLWAEEALEAIRERFSSKKLSSLLEEGPKNAEGRGGELGEEG
ncbi:MAG: YihY/virulence factor BrkB family protein [Deltaproteobacteria bacterium]|nr:MAG: YihY/virulence factor BrkB family protein [Deltaproteobacteria bacterium]